MISSFISQLLCNSCWTKINTCPFCTNKLKKGWPVCESCFRIGVRACTACKKAAAPQGQKLCARCKPSPPSQASPTDTSLSSFKSSSAPAETPISPAPQATDTSVSSPSVSCDNHLARSIQPSPTAPLDNYSPAGSLASAHSHYDTPPPLQIADGNSALKIPLADMSHSQGNCTNPLYLKMC